MLAQRSLLVLLIALLALNGCTMWKEKAATSWSGATGGEQLERLFWNDVKAKNFREIEAHLAATFVAVDARGVYDRATTIEHLKALELTDYVLADFSVQPNGADIIVSYTGITCGSYNGQPLRSTPVHMMTVWQQVKKGWIAIAHSEAAGTAQ